MDKHNYQFLVILLALIIGAGASYYFTSNQAAKEIQKIADEKVKAVQEEVDKRLAVEYLLSKEILHLDSLTKRDSLTIRTLQKEILQDGVKTELKREKAKQFTKDEKINFLLDRYRSN